MEIHNGRFFFCVLCAGKAFCEWINSDTYLSFSCLGREPVRTVVTELVEREEFERMRSW